MDGFDIGNYDGGSLCNSAPGDSSQHDPAPVATSVSAPTEAELEKQWIADGSTNSFKTWLIRKVQGASSSSAAPAKPKTSERPQLVWEARQMLLRKYQQCMDDPDGDFAEFPTMTRHAINAVLDLEAAESKELEARQSVVLVLRELRAAEAKCARETERADYNAEAAAKNLTLVQALRDSRDRLQGVFERTTDYLQGIHDGAHTCEDSDCEGCKMVKQARAVLGDPPEQKVKP